MKPAPLQQISRCGIARRMTLDCKPPILDQSIIALPVAQFHLQFELPYLAVFITGERAALCIREEQVALLWITCLLASPGHKILLSVLPSDTPLMLAAKAGHKACVKVLLTGFAVIHSANHQDSMVSCT